MCQWIGKYCTWHLLEPVGTIVSWCFRDNLWLPHQSPVLAPLAAVIVQPHRMPIQREQWFVDTCVGMFKGRLFICLLVISYDCVLSAQQCRSDSSPVKYRWLVLDECDVLCVNKTRGILLAHGSVCPVIHGSVLLSSRTNIKQQFVIWAWSFHGICFSAFMKFPWTGYGSC